MTFLNYRNVVRPSQPTPIMHHRIPTSISIIRVLVGYLLSRSRAAVPAQMKAAPTLPRFYTDVWLCFAVQNWVLDVGRPVSMVTA